MLQVRCSDSHSLTRPPTSGRIVTQRLREVGTDLLNCESATWREIVVHTMRRWGEVGVWP